LGRNISATASTDRAFRAPISNELDRGFRIANVDSEQSVSERAGPYRREAGMNVTALDRKLELRGTFFWSDIVDAVQNVTINPTSY